MEMIPCQRCGKPFASNGPKTCPKCMRRLEEIYERVRTYIRDHSDREVDIPTIAEELGEDVRDIELLAYMGWLDRDTEGPDQLSPEERKKQELLKEFQKGLSKDGKKRGAGTYGSERHGRR